VTRGPARIEIPGFLLASEHEAAAVLVQEQRVVARVRPGEVGGYDRLMVPAGAWDLTVESEGMPLLLRVRHEKLTVQTGRSSAPMRLDMHRDHRIALELRNTSQRDARVVRVVLTRADE